MQTFLMLSVHLSSSTTIRNIQTKFGWYVPLTIFLKYQFTFDCSKNHKQT